MCGISGIINFDQTKVKEEELVLMMQKMKHRGPDDEGIFIEDNVGLGFVRLSILDLSPAGHQPMFSDDQKYVLIFNGEIYNYIEIRDELKAKYKFYTRTDTEVILKAYQEWGRDCLKRFNGMFAFVLYDRESKEIFAARDRFGIKPFYYYKDEDRLIFASELKSILPLVKKKEPNNRLIYDYLLFNRTDHSNETFFKNISKLNHGSTLEINNAQCKIQRWYKISDKIKPNKKLDKKEYRDLFLQSLKLRLRADVPIGVSLSGGIDSSSIVACLIHDFGLKELNTFSGVFGKDEPTDESDFIDAFQPIVKNMHFIMPDEDSFYDDFNRFIEAHNEPIPGTGTYIQFKVMELASKHVTVTLDGQGADEQLAGYHYFFGSYFIELIRNFQITNFLSNNLDYIKKHKSINAFKYFIYYLLPAKIQTTVNKKIYGSVSKSFINKYKNKSNINKKLYQPKNLTDSLLQHFEYKLEHLLRWEDLNSMHHSIESRVPFLDHRLVEATLSTPSEQKISKGETKHILREALADVLPIKIVERKDKKGFSNPSGKWFKTDKFKRFIVELINSDSFKARGYFDSEMAKKQYNRHLSGDIDASKEIWKWINLELWFRKFID